MFERHAMTEEQLAGIAFDKVPTQPGDAVFFDSFAPHRSAPNLSDRRRRILYISYGRAADGDTRERYFADKRKNFPPDIERDPNKTYAYKVLRLGKVVTGTVTPLKYFGD